MSQFGSMDEEKVKTKPLLLSAMNKKKKPLLSAMNKKKPPPPPSFLSEAQVFSLLLALLFACVYAGFAAYNLRDPFCQEPEPEPEPEPAAASWLNPSYMVTGADNVAATLALLRGLMWCSAPQAAAAALALLAGGRGRRGLGVRAAACAALAATAASHWMCLRVHGLIDRPPGDLLLAFNTVVIVAAAALDLLVFMTFVLGVDE